MEHEIFSALKIPTTTQWLKEHLRKRGMAQKTFASLVDISGSQLSHILSDKEKVPERIVRHACRIFGLNNVDTNISIEQAKLYDSYRDLDQSLSRICNKNPNENLSGLVRDINNRLFEVAVSLYKHSLLLNEASRLQRLSLFFSDADLLIRQLVNIYLREQKFLLTPEHIGLHLRQPFSSYVGAIIKIGNSTKNEKLNDLRDLILNEFRQLARGPYQIGTTHDYAQQHAVHMLRRYGDEKDQSFTDKYLTTDDVQAQRMALFGMSLGGDTAVDSHLFSLMRDDNRFLQAVASFDGVHYGDVTLIDGRLPTVVTSLEVAISNSLAYIAQDVLNENLDLNFIKLTAFLRHYGPTTFTPTHFIAIRETLKVMSLAKNLSLPRHEFQLQFQSLLKNRT